MDAKTYAAAVALIMVGVGVGYVLMGPFPETTEAMSDDGGGGQYDPPHSSQVSFLNYNDTYYGKQYQSFWKEGNRVTSDRTGQSYQVIFYDYDMNVIMCVWRLNAATQLCIHCFVASAVVMKL